MVIPGGGYEGATAYSVVVTYGAGGAAVVGWDYCLGYTAASVVRCASPAVCVVAGGYYSTGIVVDGFGYAAGFFSNLHTLRHEVRALGFTFAPRTS